MSLSKTFIPCLVLVQARKTCPDMTENLVIGCKASKQTSKKWHHDMVCTVKRKNTIIIQLLLCDYVIRDLFHVCLNRFEFHFLRLHIIKTSKFCYFMHNGRVPGIAK